MVVRMMMRMPMMVKMVAVLVSLVDDGCCGEGRFWGYEGPLGGG